ncbi:hypothetical protein HPB50_019568 [Hyalomma asiaticum]|uniref:Uncharacterized protein n=1 Tax=Hyalomma asiaticum TaxID=266040 RepID=A0ACB7T3M9_HYAAI|nr:hypothetical protein HPB50_019568 [Hyalomma asiaticum]
MQKEEPTSSPEASPKRPSAFDERDVDDHAATLAHETPKKTSASPPPASGSSNVGSSRDQTESESEDVPGVGVPLQVCLEVGERRGSYEEPACAVGRSRVAVAHHCSVHLCPYTTHNATTMREHLPVHTGERPFRCPICGKRFSRKKYFRVHLRIHDKKGDNDVFGAGGDSGGTPGDAATSAGSSHECETCGETFAQRHFLQRHVQTAHPALDGGGGSDGSNSGGVGNVCPECNKSYKYAGNLRTHMRIHTGERPYMCDVCGLRFTCSSYLQVHLRTHVQEKPYACPQCSKTFVHNSALTVHLRTHTGERPYQCPRCPLRFSHLRNMKRHEICIHTHEYPHVCAYCHRGFLVITQWREHVRSQHGLECDDLGEGDDDCTPRHGRKPGATARPAVTHCSPQVILGELVHLILLL